MDSLLTAIKALRTAHTYANTSRPATAWAHCDRASRLLHAARCEAVRAMRAEGRSWAAISEVTGLSTTTLHSRFAGPMPQLPVAQVVDELAAMIPRPRENETDEEAEVRRLLRSQMATLRGFTST